MNTYIEAATPAAPVAVERTRFHYGVRTAIWLLAAFGLLWLASALLPSVIRHTRLEVKLTSAISTALGRPAEVGDYDFALLGGPSLEARSVSVAEDPRFGTEYFLRANSMSLRLSWTGLLRGHIEPTGIFLDQPTLNLVRNTAGEWNLAEWLPKPSMPGESTSSNSSSRRSLGPGFTAIEIDGGRINFKHGFDKLPFALTNLSGRAETDSSGRWQLDMTATPWRAAVDVQQVGILHTTGYLGGTSSRLWPASLNISWSDASLSDFVRLAVGDDYGIRGVFAASLNAATHSGDGSWAVNAFAQVAQVHRWDLALRADNPSVNLYARTNWNPADSSIELNDVRFDAPRSNGRLSIRIWPSAADQPPKGKTVARPPFLFTVPAAQIDASDLLAWVRAFRSGISNNLNARGELAVAGSANGGVVQTLSADVLTSGVSVTGLLAPLQIGPLHLQFDRGAMTLPAATIRFGGDQSALELDALAKRGRDPSNEIHLSGEIADARLVLAAGRAFGWDVARGWDVAGPVHADLRWEEPAGIEARGWTLQPTGSFDWGLGGSALLRAPFLNLPISEIRAHVDLKPSAHHVALSSARAFGAQWSGTLDSTMANPGWQFTLSGDHLAAADLDRWLNPRWRESFLDRMLPFLSSNPSSLAASFSGLIAAGHLDVARFALGMWNFNRLDGDLAVDGRRVAFKNVSAQLSHGTVQGAITIHAGPLPAYAVDAAFTHVDISTLTDPLPALSGLFDGSASGEIKLETRGSSRADAVTGLTCSGEARIDSPQLLKFDLMASLADVSAHIGATRFPLGRANFRCENRVVALTNFTLSSEVADLEGTGTVDFNRNMDLTIRRISDSSDAAPASFHLSGTLADPQVAPATAAARRAR